MASSNESGGNLLLLAAGGFALYYFWPQISASLGSSAASVGTGDIGQYPYPAGQTGAPGATATTPAGLTPAQLQLLMALQTQSNIIAQQNTPAATPTTAPAPTTSAPPQGPSNATLQLQQAQIQANIMAAQNAANAALANTNTRVVYEAEQAPPPAPVAVTVTPTNSSPDFVAQWAAQSNAASGLKGTRRLRGPVSPEAMHAALMLQAHLNNSVTYDAAQVTNSSPIGPWTPGAERLPGGCYRYGNTPVLMNCPPGVSPAQPRDEANGNCLPGFTMSASGQCAKSDDQAQLMQLNSTAYVQGNAIQFPNVSPTILGLYVSTIGVNPGSVLAAMIGLPTNQAYGTFAHGNDGFNYLMVDGVFLRQGTATQLTRNTGPIGPRPGPFPAGTRLMGVLPSAVPVTNATLIAASSDPSIAAVLGNDPRGMLTVAQWNYFYTQSTGVLQAAPPYPQTNPNALMSAQQYQAWRIQAGLTPAPPKKNGKLGLIENSRPGAFPLGGISDGPARSPFVQPGNHTVYRVPGRGMVTARLGVIHDGGGNHRWVRSPFPRAAGWRRAG